MTIRRLKTYTGSQGYVYQYYFVGKRISKASDGLAGGALESEAADSETGNAATGEYVFDVTSDRKLTYAVGIFLSREVAAAWAISHGRPLAVSEQYAAVKMRLFRAFDELEDMQTQGRELHVDYQSLAESLTALGVE
ncbi:MAG: hypothetical protein ABSD64_02665 [Terriglobales bacterium]|jgi:hypothetical protein